MNVQMIFLKRRVYYETDHMLISYIGVSYDDICFLRG